MNYILKGTFLAMYRREAGEESLMFNRFFQLRSVFGSPQAAQRIHAIVYTYLMWK